MLFHLICILYSSLGAWALKIQEVPSVNSKNSSQLSAWSRYFQEELEMSAKGRRRRRRRRRRDGEGGGNNGCLNINGCSEYMAGLDPHGAAGEQKPGWDYIHPMCWFQAPEVGGVNYEHCILDVANQQSPVNIWMTGGAGGQNPAPIAADSSNTAFPTFTHPVAGGSAGTGPDGNAQMYIQNNGHALQVNYPAEKQGVFTWDSVAYKLLQVHLHMPSEHAIDGALATGEIHMVHQKVDSTGTDDLLVIGVFVQTDPGSYSAKADIIMGDLFGLNGLHDGQDAFGPTQYGTGDGVQSGANFNLDAVFENLMASTDNSWGAYGGAANRNYYQYDGSLTTPPCSPTVKWLILERPVYATATHVANFKSMFPNPMNNRPLNLLGERTIIKNGPPTTRGTAATFTCGPQR